jgi:hypothetical protein
MFFVFKKPFKYEVAGYGVFNCVNGGVMSNKSFTLGIYVAKLRILSN